MIMVDVVRSWWILFDDLSQRRCRGVVNDRSYGGYGIRYNRQPRETAVLFHRYIVWIDCLWAGCMKMPVHRVIPTARLSIDLAPLR